MRVLVKAVAGSHLFGLNTPSSDIDYKGVYIPEADDIILGRIKRSINTSTNPTSSKNTAEDIDCEFYSLDKFLKMVQEGQTVALELLFTPDEYIIEKDPLWDKIVDMRSKFLHKNVTAFIGYAKTQANRYGIRGSRMGTMLDGVNLLKSAQETLDNDNARLAWIWDEILEFVEHHEHSSIMNLPANKNMQNVMVEHWEICGRKFDKTLRINHLLTILEKLYGEYGERSRLAQSNSGIDFKAVSHALRVCYQGHKLLQEWYIQLPIKGKMRQFLIDVKTGKLDFTTEVQPKLESMMRELHLLREWSNLPERLDNEFIDGLILKVYRQVIRGETTYEI